MSNKTREKARRDVAGGSETVNEEAAFLQAIQGVRPLPGGKRIARPGPPDHHLPVPESNPQWLQQSGQADLDLSLSDRFVRGRSASVSKRTMESLVRGEFAVHSHIDLHGMVLEDAMQAVDFFIADRHKHGQRCVLIVTGKGRNSPGQQGVLRQQIPEWLARGPSARLILGFASARPCDGGEGALYVLLVKQVSGKHRIDVETGAGF